MGWLHILSKPLTEFGSKTVKTFKKISLVLTQSDATIISYAGSNFRSVNRKDKAGFYGCTLSSCGYFSTLIAFSVIVTPQAEKQFC